MNRLVRTKKSLRSNLFSIGSISSVDTLTEKSIHTYGNIPSWEIDPGLPFVDLELSLHEKPFVKVCEHYIDVLMEDVYVERLCFFYEGCLIPYQVKYVCRRGQFVRAIPAAVAHIDQIWRSDSRTVTAVETKRLMAALNSGLVDAKTLSVPWMPTPIQYDEEDVVVDYLFPRQTAEEVVLKEAKDHLIAEEWLIRQDWTMGFLSDGKMAIPLDRFVERGQRSSLAICPTSVFGTEEFPTDSYYKGQIVLRKSLRTLNEILIPDFYARVPIDLSTPSKLGYAIYLQTPHEEMLHNCIPLTPSDLKKIRSDIHTVFKNYADFIRRNLLATTDDGGELAAGFLTMERTSNEEVVICHVREGDGELQALTYLDLSLLALRSPALCLYGEE